MRPENAASIWVILNKARNGWTMDENRLIEAIDTINKRRDLKPLESAAMGYFILEYTRMPERAYPYFAQAILETRDSAFATSLIDDLRKEGHPAWADQLSRQRRSPDTSGGRSR